MTNLRIVHCAEFVKNDAQQMLLKLIELQELEQSTTYDAFSATIVNKVVQKNVWL